METIILLSIKSIRHILAIAFFGLLVFPVAAQKKPKNGEVNRQNEIKAEYHTIKGMGKFLLEDYDEALKLFKEALQLSPDNAGIHFKIAETYFLLGVKSQATLHVKRSIELDDDNESYYVLLANIHKSELRPELAVSAYEQLLKKKPKLVDYHFDLAELYSNLGRSYYQQKLELTYSETPKKGKKAKRLKEVTARMDDNFNKALGSLRQIEKKYGINEEITTNIQLILMRQDKLDEAYKEGDKLIEANPDSPEYRVFQAELYQSNNEIDKAVKLLEETTKLYPEYGRTHLMLSDMYKKLDKRDEAITELELAFKDQELPISQKAAKLGPYLMDINAGDNKEIALMLIQTIADIHPEDAHANTVIGDYYQAVGDNEKARKYYRKVIELDENNLTMWQKVVAYDLELEDKENLIKDSEEALELFPNQPILWLYNGMGYSLNKEHDKAIRSLEQGKKLSSDREMKNTFNAQLGDIYNDAKDYLKSDEAYEAVLAVNPQDAHVLNNFAYFLSLRGEKLPKAKEMSKKLISIHPDNPTYLDTYGWVLFMLGEYDESKLVLEKAASKLEDGTIIEHYGDALFKAGEVDKAVEQWIKAQKLGGTTDNIEEKIEERKYIP